MNFEELERLTAADEAASAHTAKNVWLLSLCDLLCCILAFFVMLYSTRDLSQERFYAINDSFVKYIYGSSKGMEYNFTKKYRSDERLVKKAENITYLATLMRNLLRDDEGVVVDTNNNRIVIEFDEDYQNLDALMQAESLNGRLFQLSKSFSSLSNQLEVSVDMASAATALKIADGVAAKIEDLGYDHRVMRSLSAANRGTDNDSAEKVEKSENKVKIRFVINPYESIL